MSVLNEVIQAAEIYKANTNETPRFIVLPINRARSLVKELVIMQGENCPEGLRELNRMEKDHDFVEFMNGFSLAGIRIMVLVDQLVLGGWADDCVMQRGDV